MRHRVRILGVISAIVTFALTYIFSPAFWFNQIVGDEYIVAMRPLNFLLSHNEVLAGHDGFDDFVSMLSGSLLDRDVMKIKVITVINPGTTFSAHAVQFFAENEVVLGMQTFLDQEIARQIEWKYRLGPLNTIEAIHWTVQALTALITTAVVIWEAFMLQTTRRKKPSKSVRKS